jgi:hypothetical protein
MIDRVAPTLGSALQTSHSPKESFSDPKDERSQNRANLRALAFVQQ